MSNLADIISHFLANTPSPAIWLPFMGSLLLAAGTWMSFDEKPNFPRLDGYIFTGAAMMGFSTQMSDLEGDFNTAAQNFDSPLPHSSWSAILTAIFFAAIALAMYILTFVRRSNLKVIDRMVFMLASIVMMAVVAWELSYRFFGDAWAYTYGVLNVVAVIALLTIGVKGLVHLVVRRRANRRGQLRVLRDHVA